MQPSISAFTRVLDVLWLHASLEGWRLPTIYSSDVAPPRRRPPISGLPEIGFILRKSAGADLRWLVRVKKARSLLRVTAKVSRLGQ